MEEKKIIIDGHEAVDLGLSVKWATCNIGANTPEELGEKYHWGEIEPPIEKSRFYDKEKGNGFASQEKNSLWKRRRYGITKESL